MHIHSLKKQSTKLKNGHMIVWMGMSMNTFLNICVIFFCHVNVYVVFCILKWIPSFIVNTKKLTQCQVISSQTNKLQRILTNWQKPFKEFIFITNKHDKSWHQMVKLLCIFSFLDWDMVCNWIFLFYCQYFALRFGCIKNQKT